MNTSDFFPKRIVCLTEETTEVLYLLGEDHRIVGISGFTKRPERARKEKPKVSNFLDAKIDTIIELKPDLVIGFSDIQSQIAQELISKGVTVWINNYRSVVGIYKMIIQLGALVGASEKAYDLIKKIKSHTKEIQAGVSKLVQKPKVYFEEWYEPLISSIQWVSELIEIAGGVDLFPENRNASLAKDRIILNSEEVVKRNPDIIIASWCGKKFKKEKMIARENWQNINAIKNDMIFEINSTDILQPGPAALTDGVSQIFDIIKKWDKKQHSN